VTEIPVEAASLGRSQLNPVRVDGESQEIGTGGSELSGLALIANGAAGDRHRAFESGREGVAERLARGHRVEDFVETPLPIVLRRAAIEIEEQATDGGRVGFAELHSQARFREEKRFLDHDARADSADSRGESPRGRLRDAPGLAEDPHRGAYHRGVEPVHRSRQDERVGRQRDAVGDSEGEVDASIDGGFPVESQVTGRDLPRAESLEIEAESRALARKERIDALRRGRSRTELEPAERPGVERDVDPVRESLTDIADGDEELELLVGAHHRRNGEGEIEKRLADQDPSGGAASECYGTARETVQNGVDVEGEEVESFLLSADQKLGAALLAGVERLVSVLFENRLRRRLRPGRELWQCERAV
jgi:hypothetical protein